MTQNCLVVAAADAMFFDLAQGCIQSLRDKPESRSTALAFFDLGCTDEQRSWLRGRVDFVQQPDWEFSFKDRAKTPGYLRGLLARPFLRRYFPGFEVYLWIDSDAWVQDWRAVDLFVEGARRRTGLAIVPEVDRGSQMQYGGLPQQWKQVQGWYEMAYGAEVAQELCSFPILNAGVFALHRDAPHWGVWEQSLRQALERTASNVTDQMALNYAVYRGGLFPRTELLPAWCNWTCHSGMPFWDVGGACLVEPYLPHTPIGVLHLTARKHRQHRLFTTQGLEMDVRVRYPAGPAEAEPAKPAAASGIPAALMAAIGHHEAGRWPAAEQGYREFLTMEPNHAGAWHLLGIVSAQRGNRAGAVEYLYRALTVKPDWPEAQSNLGNVWREQGQLDEAMACYRRALALKPDYAEAHHGLCAVWRDQGKVDEAAAHAFEQHRAGRSHIAEQICRQLLAIDPRHAAVGQLLQVITADQGRQTPAS